MERRSETERKTEARPVRECAGSRRSSCLSGVHSVSTGMSLELAVGDGGYRDSRTPRASRFPWQFERSRTTGHRLRSRRDSGSWYAAVRPRLRRLLVHLADARRHRTLLCTVTRITGGSWIRRPLSFPGRVYVYLSAGVVDITDEPSQAGVRRCIPGLPAFPKCTRRFPLAKGTPQRGRLIGGHCPRTGLEGPWSISSLLFTFAPTGSPTSTC